MLPLPIRGAEAVTQFCMTRCWRASPEAARYTGAAPGSRAGFPTDLQRAARRRDVSFYGNKLFQSAFIAVIAPGASILTGLLWTLLNSLVALVRPGSPALRPCSPSAWRAGLSGVWGF
jgi:hypothetical protein